MTFNRREVLKLAGCGCAVPMACIASGRAHTLEPPNVGVTDSFTVLPPGAIHFEGYLERYIRRSLERWSKAAIPYAALAEFFRTGRPVVQRRGTAQELFAAGEMWGKAVRSGALFYRYTADQKLKDILQHTVADVLSTRRANGSISCVPVERQPDGPGGDLWERAYVLLGLDDYYEWVERDPAVLQAMIDEADATLGQVGLPPKVRIVDLGWSSNHIESSTILEPIMRLYRRTGYSRYLEFARYIVETEGGARGFNIFDEVLAGDDPVSLGGIYPKAYEMLSLFEGLVEYYRATRDERWRDASLKLFQKVIEKEITIIGNGGGDEPYHPNVAGEAWDNTALEQTNPDIKRMMETCTGVTWSKFCHQLLRLTGNPIAADYIELYAYNGLIGAMKPSGDGFSYVNLLNGVKTNPRGYGATIQGVYVTCCNLNGPEGLGYLPLTAVMTDAEGPVVNLYNAGTVSVESENTGKAQLRIDTTYPLDGHVRIAVVPGTRRAFTIKLRIPSWSTESQLSVNGEKLLAQPGTYARVERRWNHNDVIDLQLDMRCRVLEGPQGFHEGSTLYRALVRGPVVLARDENLDPGFNEPVDIISTNGVVDLKAERPTLAETNLQYEVPTRRGPISMVDYASVNSWDGKRVQTWLPIVRT